MKKFAFLAAAFSAAALCLTTAGCGPSGDTDTVTAAKKLKIGVSVMTATHGWSGGIGWFAEHAKKAIEAENDDVEVLVTAGEDAEKQANAIENLVLKGVDALVVVCQEPGPLTAACERAKKQGVYLVVVSNPLDKPVQDVFVNGDNRSLGEEAARALGSILGGKGDILMMEGFACPINTDRVNGFRDVMAKEFPEIKIMDSQLAYWNQEKGMNLMETYLLKYPKIDGVWAGDDDVLLGALQAYEKSGRKDIQAMVGGGGSKYIIKKVMDRDPVVKATVTYSPKMCEDGIYKALEGLRNGKKPVDGVSEVVIKSEIVTPENAEKYYYPESVY